MFSIWQKTTQKGSSWLFYVLIIYVLLAGIWWSYLLRIKNADALEAKKALLWHKMQAQGLQDKKGYFESKEYQELVYEYQKQDWMILGEGLVLLGLIFAGVWQIYQSRKKEVALAQQQQNFLLSITHELKSPIAGIQLVLQTIKKRGSLRSEQLERLSSNGLKDSQRLHRLVEDLLLAARMEGGYSYHFEPIVVNELLEEIAESMRHLVPGQLHCQLPPYQLSMQGDRSTLSSLLYNLLDNAIKYAGESEKIELRLFCKEEKLFIELADQGPGLAKQERQRIFEKFYRPGSEHTRKKKGTGLGLFIAQKIALAHRGEISLHDNQPQGLVFRLSFPCLSKSEAIYV